MPNIEVDGASIWYSVDGRAEAPPLLLIHSLATTHELWARQVPAFTAFARVIRYDMRGHGGSTSPAGELTIERFGRDALAVLDAAGVSRADVAGVSLGGLTTVWLGAHAPDRVRRLVLANTAARIGTSDTWSARIRAVREGGMELAADLAIPRWFTDGFRENHADIVAAYRAMVLACPLESYVGACAALRDADLRAGAQRIAAPALVIAGSEDRSTPRADSEWMRDNFPDAHMELLEAAHLANVERPEEFTELVRDFLV
ncbi:MAG TPA: 3-oxoadipate enol-lactonase [Gemmatimonadaceae bacterium]